MLGVQQRHSVDVVGDAITELCGFEDADVRAERQDIDDGAVDRVEPERGLEPTLVVGWRSRSDAEGLQASEHRSEPPSLRGHLDHGPSPAPSPSRLRPPALRVCQLGCRVGITNGDHGHQAVLTKDFDGMR